jgi:Tfp pilus assembly pilus retraction ATPase PilT
MARLDEMLQELLQRSGSDLHLMAGEPPRIRVHGDLLPMREALLQPGPVQEMLFEIMPRRAIEQFEQQDCADFAYDIAGQARFRVNVLRHQYQHPCVKAAHGVAQQSPQVRLAPVLCGRKQIKSHRYIVRQTDQKKCLQKCTRQIKYCLSIQPVVSNRF